MSLSDRLKRADIERKLAAGVVTSEAALKPDPATEPDWIAEDPLAQAIRIEVPPAALVSVVEPDPTHHTLFTGTTGAALTSSCPSCNRPGRIDMVDLVGHRNHLSCTSCGAMWQVSTDATPAHTD
jgi:hypothetical protein